MLSSLITLSSSINPSNLGESVVFTTIVSANPPGSGNPAPTGSILFESHIIPGGPGFVSIGEIQLTHNQPVNGESEAMLTISNLSVGNHAMIARYGGDSNYIGNSSAIITQSVNGTTTLLTSSVNPSSVGEKVTYTVTVISDSGSGTPTGTVLIIDSGQNYFSETRLTLDTSAQASTSVTYTSVDNHSIVAEYSGDSNFAASSGSLTQTVVKHQH